MAHYGQHSDPSKGSADDVVISEARLKTTSVVPRCSPDSYKRESEYKAEEGTTPSCHDVCHPTGILPRDMT